jgi:hypothetical protein
MAMCRIGLRWWRLVHYSSDRWRYNWLETSMPSRLPLLSKFWWHVRKMCFNKFFFEPLLNCPDEKTLEYLWITLKVRRAEMETEADTKQL